MALIQFPRLSKLAFYITFILTLITGFCTVLFVSIEFHDWQGLYAAFGQLTDVSFVHPALSAPVIAEQSVGIAVCK